MLTVNRRIYPFLIALLLMASSCSKEGSDEGQVFTDVAYGSNIYQKMDIYLPPGSAGKQLPVLVMVHGGSWSGGDKIDFNEYIASIRSLLPNHAIANVNYRLSNGGSVLLPQQMEDMNAAIRFLGSNAATYGTDTTKMGLMGASAGAHLVLLRAYKTPSSGVKAVIDLFGPTSLTWMYYNHPSAPLVQPILITLIGQSADTNPTAYAQGSPINYVSAAAPPTYIFHGTADVVVPISESDRLNTALQNALVTHHYITYPNEGHGWDGAPLTDTYNRATDFIKQQVK